MKRILPFLLSFLYTLSAFSALSNQDTLLVGYAPAAPFLIEKNNAIEGISIYLWEEIAKELELPYRYVKRPFAELLQALENGEIDVCINPLTITSERGKQFAFTHSFYASNSTVATHEATGFQRLKNTLTSIFNQNFLSAFLALITVIIFFGWLLWHFEKKVNPDQFRTGWQGLWDGIWWSVVTMTTVGYGDKTPKSKGGKIVALVWMFSGLLFISGFTASIAYRLTVNQLAANAKQVLDFKERPIGCIQNSSTASFLKRNFFKKVTLYGTVLEGLEAVDAHQIDAFFYDEPILKYKLSEMSSLHHIILLPLKFDMQFYAFGLPKDRLELREQLSQQILEHTEHQEWRIILGEYGLVEY